MQLTALVVVGMALWAAMSLYILLKTDYLHPKIPYQLPPISTLELFGGFFVFFISYALFIPLGEVFSLVVFPLLFFLYCFMIRETLFPYFRHKGFFVGVLSWSLIFPLIYFWSQGLELLTQALLGTEPIEQSAILALKQHQGKPWVFPLVIFLVILPFPAIEEILFRGLMQNWIRVRGGPLAAILISALIFAFFHFSPNQGWSNLTILSSLFFLGCFLGVLFEKTKSLKTSIGLHSTFNAMSVLFLFARDAFR